jgi:threonine synthase
VVTTNIHQPSTNYHVKTGWKGLIEEYRPYLPVTDATPVITLREGNTPLIPVSSISKMIGRNVQVDVKYDGLNPTG